MNNYFFPHTVALYKYNQGVVAHKINKMLLDKKENWYARVEGEVKILEEIEQGMPINIGGITISSEDNERSFILDPWETNFVNEEKAGGTISFMCKLDIDKESFPVDDFCSYDLLVEDLEKATATFYFSDCDFEKGKVDFENHTVKLTFYFDRGNVDVDVELEQ